MIQLKVGTKLKCVRKTRNELVIGKIYMVSSLEDELYFGVEGLFSGNPELGTSRIKGHKRFNNSDYSFDVLPNVVIFINDQD